jgi:NADPH-dependent ferric siderophore reductase
MNEMSPGRHQILRMRRDVRKRGVAVAAVEQVTPKMRRIRFASPELHDFESLGFDDHVKLFVPDGEGGVCMRDYTPRAFDAAAGTLTIDFALHEAGPATSWALGAQTGDRLEIGGPRGSTIVADDFDWYLLIGDETALPAMGRMVEQQVAGTMVITVAVVDNAAERQDFVSEAAWEAHWVFRAGAARDDAALLLAALAQRGGLPDGEGFVWIAGEAVAARAVRAHVLGLGHNKAWLKASGYWQAGESGAHEKLGD